MFSVLFYIAPARNLDGILTNGIQPRANIGECDTAFDISNHGVQVWRTLPEPVYNRPINSYAPLYINPRNPMLYEVQNRHADLVILGISSAILDSHIHLFADGNAACRDTCFSTDSAVLSPSLPALQARYWNDIPEGKRRRMAEVLVHPVIEPSFVTEIHCKNHTQAVRLSRLFGLKTVADSPFFF